jgi:predicted 2-oxoglutarate/Fe(II)-dependent dioxygenase YbiX
MEKHLDAYIKVYDAIPKELCDATLASLQNKNIVWEQNTFYNNHTRVVKTFSEEKEPDVSYETTSVNEELMRIVWESIHKYITELNFHWFDGWAGFSQLRFNKYNESKLMAKHCDHINTMFDGERKGIPVLSIVGVLNDDYEGGEFVMFDDTTIELPKGSLLIFPSNFLYPHQVLPVTKGTRHAFVSWVW